MASAVDVCHQGCWDTRSGHLFTDSQVAWDVEWEHLSPVALCRDGMGSLMALPGDRTQCCTGHSALLSINSAALGSVCAGPGAAAMDHLSLMATVHFHLDRGISISVCHLFTTVRLKTQISCFLPHTTPDALWAQEPQRVRGNCRPAQGTARGENTGPLELRGSPQHLCTCNCCTAFCALSGPR